MRLLKFLLGLMIAIFAITAGVMVAAAVAIGGALIFLVHRLLRKPRAAQQVEAPRSQRVAAGDVIDVTATEVPAERSAQR